MVEKQQITMDKIVEIENLSKSYDGKQFALKKCSFSLEKGKIYAIVGESGSGKSTLLRLIAGLERPNTGTIKIKEKIVSSDKQMIAPQERHIGFVFQDFTLFPHLTVAQNIAFGLKNNQEKIVKELLELIKMENYGKVYPAELSGGQEQRVAIARTLALEPELLLLDEPFSNLDASLKANLRQEIRQIVKNVGTSMLFITHDIFDAIDIADEILLLQDGYILHHSTMENFTKNIENQTVQNTLSQLKINAEKVLQLF